MGALWSLERFVNGGGELHYSFHLSRWVRARELTDGLFSFRQIDGKGQLDYKVFLR
jgi:hypothetical protein